VRKLESVKWLLMFKKFLVMYLVWLIIFKKDGSQLDVLLKDSNILSLWFFSITIMPVPGHTPADLAYHISDVLFIGDTIFMPDYGSARCYFLLVFHLL
jgi:glyoxylase-like metal-dependent hydrolase (beta-lactamase superfamily II)